MKNIDDIYETFNERIGNSLKYTRLENYMLYLCDIPTATATEKTIDGTYEWTVAYINGKWVYIDAVTNTYNANKKTQRIAYVYNENLYIIEDPYTGTQKKDRVNVLQFKDTDLTDWYYNSVKYMKGNGYMSGTTETTFSPNSKLTRGMLVTILHNMERKPKATGTSKFLDVQNKNMYYYNAVLWASNNKIVNGYSNGKFGADDYITREQLATILCNYCKYKGKYKANSADYSKFADKNKISSFAKNGMNWAVGNKIVNGSNGKLNPQGTASRAEAAAMIYNYCIKIK